jgi:hypothetical protein
VRFTINPESGVGSFLLHAERDRLIPCGVALNYLVLLKKDRMTGWVSHR